MKNFKLIAVLSGLTMFLASACAKHAIPNYYDKDGNKISFKEVKLTAKCNSKLGFSVNNENKYTLDKFGTHKQYIIRTILVSDSQALNNPKASIKNGADAPTEAEQNVAGIKNQDDLISKYPVDHTVAENQTAAENILVNQNCDEGQADYTGPGTTTGITGPIQDVTTTSVEIKGTDSSLGKPQQVDVKVERIIPDGTVSGKSKRAMVIAQDRDTNGLYSFKITLVKTTAVGSRTIVFTQDVVDDTVTKATISKDLAQEYLAALDASSDIAKSLSTALTKVNSPTLDFNIADLMSVRDAIVARRKAGVAPTEQTQTTPATPAADAAPAASTPVAPTPAAVAPTVQVPAAPTAGDAAPNPNGSTVTVEHTAAPAAVAPAADQSSATPAAPATSTAVGVDQANATVAPAVPEDPTPVGPPAPTAGDAKP